MVFFFFYKYLLMSLGNTPSHFMIGTVKLCASNERACGGKMVNSEVSIGARCFIPPESPMFLWYKSSVTNSAP